MGKIIKINLVFYITTIILLVTYSCKSNESFDEKESLVVENFSDFDINFNDTLNKIVFIKNKTEDKIKITDVENGCGCTSLILNDSLIKPHDSLALKLIYIPVKSGDTGNVTKYFTLRVDQKPFFKNLILKGRVTK